MTQADADTDFEGWDQVLYSVPRAISLNTVDIDAMPGSASLVSNSNT